MILWDARLLLRTIKYILNEKSIVCVNFQFKSSGSYIVDRLH